MKFTTAFAAATALAASAATVSALAIPRSDSNVAREIGALSGGAWSEQIEARSELNTRIVWNPTITKPHAHQSFVAGTHFGVAWDASDAPESFNTSAPVVIKLGYDDGGPGGLHEHWDLVKASDHVPLSSGHADVALPDSLEARDDYIVVVMGDSGNASPKFSVTAKSAAKRIVYNPTITSPSGGESFAAGSKTTLTWSLDGLPEQLKDSHVEVRLGYAPSENDEGYHEKWSLGQFPITDGKAHVTLPSDLNPREDYLFVLLGDSGNFSKQFKVTTA